MNDEFLKAGMMIEWPIEDGTVTTRQLERAVAGLQMLVDKYAPVLDTAIAAGKIDFDKAS